MACRQREHTLYRCWRVPSSRRAPVARTGDYRGGELVVEGTVHDMRYRALEFDGWKQVHWTLPCVAGR